MHAFHENGTNLHETQPFSQKYYANQMKMYAFSFHFHGNARIFMKQVSEIRLCPCKVFLSKENQPRPPMKTKFLHLHFDRYNRVSHVIGFVPTTAKAAVEIKEQWRQDSQKRDPNNVHDAKVGITPATQPHPIPTIPPHPAP